MRVHGRAGWVVTGLGVALLLAGSAIGATAAAPSGSVPTPSGARKTMLARPAADRHAASDGYAPVAGVVPGYTGAASDRLVGGAAHKFKQLASKHAKRPHAPVRPMAAATASTEMHSSWGITLPSDRSNGLRATHSVLTGMAAVAHGEDVVYAPTGLSGGNACMEMTTAYTPSGGLLWAWDWCGGRDRVGKVIPMDQTFLAAYTTQVNGRPAYSMDVHQTNAANNTWTAYLYNYSTRSWDTFYTSSGTFDLPDYSFGWDIFEIYSTINPSTGKGYYCSSMRNQGFESSDMQVMSGGSWTPVTRTNSDVDRQPDLTSEMQCPSLKLSVLDANNHWFAGIGQARKPAGRS